MHANVEKTSEGTHYALLNAKRKSMESLDVQGV